MATIFPDGTTLASTLSLWLIFLDFPGAPYCDVPGAWAALRTRTA